MNFRTELNIPPSAQKINHNDTILLIGSCFSQNIGERLQKYKFKSISNPFGTVFNPVSIAKLIQYTLDNHVFKKETLQSSQGVWVHPDFHSVLSDVDKELAINKINTAIESVSKLLSEVKFLFITLGTMIAYRQKSDGSIVANCHKIPSSAFTKEISLSVLPPSPAYIATPIINLSLLERNPISFLLCSFIFFVVNSLCFILF